MHVDFVCRLCSLSTRLQWPCISSSMDWEAQRPSAPSTPTSVSSHSTSGTNSSREKVPPYKQLTPSPAVTALSKFSDDELFRKVSTESQRSGTWGWYLVADSQSSCYSPLIVFWWRALSQGQYWKPKEWHLEVDTLLQTPSPAVTALSKFSDDDLFRKVGTERSKTLVNLFLFY